MTLLTSGPAVEPTFGAGGSEPYARALRGGPDALELLDTRPPGRRRVVDVSRFARPADEVDHRVLSRAWGAVLDVGCGPGRMVAAGVDRGLHVLGIDVSRTAVRMARRAGLPILQRSVFDTVLTVLPWTTLLLLDGNVGIGGSPSTLLARCAELVAIGGRLLVEVDAEPTTDRAFTGVLASVDGLRSAPFPWAEVGHEALVRHTGGTGLQVVEVWSDTGRHFVSLERVD